VFAHAVRLGKIGRAGWALRTEAGIGAW
jgi:hypothetical protein